MCIINYDMCAGCCLCDIITRSRKQFIDTLIDTFFRAFCTFLKNIEEQGRLVKDIKKLDGVVDKLSSEQRFRKSDMITFAVQKIWGHPPSATRSYGWLEGQEADEKQVNFEIFKIRY